MNMYTFKDVKFMTAAEKQRVLKAWVRFLKDKCSFKAFSKCLYEHLIYHCSFIAHYNRLVFWEYYFDDPEKSVVFLRQFDRAQRCLGAEMGGYTWINGGDYVDLNTAMVEVAEPLLPLLYTELHARAVTGAEADLAHAQQRLTKLREG